MNRKQTTLQRTFPALSIGIFALAILLLATLPGNSNRVGKAAGPDQGEIIYYLPVVHFQPGTPASIGTETHSAATLETADKIQQANIKWARVPALNWAAIEPNRTNPPTYDWSSVDEANLINLAERNVKVIATIRFTPGWAQKYPPNTCGPVSESALDAFAAFLGEAVKRYSQAPYYIKYWEIGNEPDIATGSVAPDSNYGCWGDDRRNPDGSYVDPYFGGGYYAKMLEKATPAIRAADRAASVLVGGLLLDCDPTNPPAGKDCQPSKFLEGILVNNGKNNGASYFDFVSFHAFPGYDGAEIGDENHPYWSHRGGVVLGKIDYLRSVMASRGVSKPLFHSEGALLCPIAELCSPPGSDFFEAQADYVVWLYTRNWANGLVGTIWHTFEGPGWRYGQLLDSFGEPLPSYYALQFFTEELRGVNFSQQLFSYPGLRAYEFKSNWKRIHVLWSPDDQPHPIALPIGVLRVVDKYGNLVVPQNNQLDVKSPLYIELIP